MKKEFLYLYTDAAAAILVSALAALVGDLMLGNRAVVSYTSKLQ